MSLLNTGIVFHDRAGGGWYCYDCKRYIHHDLVPSHSHTSGSVLAGFRPSGPQSPANPPEVLTTIVEGGRGSSQDSVTPTAQGHEADNPSEVAK